MEYSIKAISTSNNSASINIKKAEIPFGIITENENNLPNPAEIFLGSLSACILKNVERFSVYMKFEYSKAEITIKAKRLEKPPRMAEIFYELNIYSAKDDLNLRLLKKNIEKFGTIYNTINTSCEIKGEISLLPA